MIHLPHTDHHVNKTLLIFGFAVLCAVASVAIFHPKAPGPNANYGDCRTVDDCRAAIDNDNNARAGITLPEASEECRNLQAQALAICSEEYENRSSDEGEWTYARRDHIKDIAICKRVSSAVLHACVGYEKGERK